MMPGELTAYVHGFWNAIMTLLMLFAVLVSMGGPPRGPRRRRRD